MRWAFLLFGALTGAACGILAPSCKDERGTVADVSGVVLAQMTALETVVSPKNSNLVMQLTWQDPSATLQLRATIIDCGIHTGCQMTASTGTAAGPNGRSLQVDGSRGKAYRVEVVGDADAPQMYRLLVTYKIACES
jgi:hypothetical protein